MKKVLVLTAVGLMAATTAAFGASIVNSKHDLSKGSLIGGVALSYTQGANTSTQICIYCHAPHNAVKSIPLWNRINPGGAGFTLYSGVNMANVSFKTGFTADSTSLFCMSCHDGVTSINAVYNAGVIDGIGTNRNHAKAANDTFTIGQGAAGAMGAAVSGNLTTNLSTTHPVNFPVAAADPQGDLHAGSLSTMGKAGFTMPLFKTADANPLRSTARSLECGSCHAVHDSANKPFLRYTMDKSALCLGCHNK